jgi:predicted amidohydrolase
MEPVAEITFLSPGNVITKRDASPGLKFALKNFGAGRHHRKMKIAVAQMTSTDNLSQNLDTMRGLLKEANEGGVPVTVFPEMAYFMGKPEECAPIIPRYAEILDEFRSWAKEFSMILLPGSLREPLSTKSAEGSPRYFNTLPLIDRTGKVITTYRKLFLFKATLPGRTYDETRRCEPGNEISSANLGETTIGLSI